MPAQGVRSTSSRVDVRHIRARRASSPGSRSGLGAIMRDNNTTTRWRTVDVVVAAVIAVAFGVIFWAWGLLWRAVDPAFAFFPAGQAIMYGVWLVPAVLGGLVIRK